MSGAAGNELDLRVLACTPTAKDGDITRSILAGVGITVEVCPTIEGLIEQVDFGAAAILVPEEVAALRSLDLLSLINKQPAWSDLPLLILTRPGQESDESVQLRSLGNVTLLDRPLRVATLVSAVRTALRARERQYQLRSHIDELARIQDSLRAADARKDEFLATLGHELRNPLSSILTGLELIRLAQLSQPRALRAVAVIERQVNHLARLVDDLLEVSRITRGVIDVRKDLVDICAILRSAVETSRGVLDASNHHLEVTLPQRPVTVLGDAVRLTQVFANLLNNAAKYTNAGGTIALEAHLEIGRVVIAVRDNGIGIEPEKLSSVFEMFTQVDRSDRRTQGGLGIGLTLVRSLVAMHGGSVEARSEGTGRGSEFIVRLPIVAQKSVVAPPMATRREFPSRRILVVDDNADAGESLGALLEALGAIAHVTHSGEEALGVLDGFHPDTVLLDIGMPGMDGYETARRIRGLEMHKSIMLVALTGWGQEEDRRRSKAAGFDHHLVKPPEIEALRSLLERRKAPRAVAH